MTLAEATSKFIHRAGQENPTAESSPEISSETQALVESLELLTTYFSRTDRLEDITPERLRDFLARWYVEKAESSPAPQPKVFLDSLAQFFRWALEYTETRMANECLTVLGGLEQSIPCAIEVAARLSKELAERGGPVSFPEFLTSFEEGGQSQYDLDAPGDVCAIEGYFKVTRVEGGSVEAEEMISEERIWPIIFPPDTAGLIRIGMVINLELVRTPEGWRVAASGFAYPPGARRV
jgi:hypothetical protein